jgi:hypothetical protein
MISAGFDFDSNHLFLLTFPLWVQLCSKWCCTEFVVCELVRDFIIVVYLMSSCQKRPNLHTNELNTTFFCSTSPLKAPNHLKSLKLA